MPAVVPLSSLPEQIFFDVAAEERKSGGGLGGRRKSICADLVPFVVPGSNFHNI